MSDIYDIYREPPQGCGTAIAGGLAVIAIAIMLCFCGCRTLPPVVTPEVHNNYNGHDAGNVSSKRDSIFVHDSIFIREKGDTVFIYREHIRDRWLTKYDSIYINDSIHIHDSVPYPVKVVKTVAVRNGYTRFTSWFFWIVLTVLLVFGAFKVCDKIPACKPYTTIIKSLLKWR